MKTRHVLLAFTFVVLTIFLIIVVSSRSSEMSRLYPDDVVVDAGMLQTTQEPQVSADPNIDVNPAPEDTNRPQDTKPDVDIDSWEYLLANSEHNIGKYSPQVVAIEDSAQYFDERAVSALEDFLNAARAAGYTPYIMTAYRPYSTQEYNYNGKASQISWPDYPDAEDYAEAAKLVAPPGTSDHMLKSIFARAYYATRWDFCGKSRKNVPILRISDTNPNISGKEENHADIQPAREKRKGAGHVQVHLPRHAEGSQHHQELRDGHLLPSEARRLHRGAYLDPQKAELRSA